MKYPRRKPKPVSSRPAERLPPKDQLIMGIHAVKEVLLHAPQRLLCVYTEEPKGGSRKSELVELCEQKRIPLVFVSFDTLTQMTGSDSHQSFAAHVKGRKFYEVSEFLDEVAEQDRTIVLMLDQIFDPQNFGALIRTAECLGAAAVVWSKNRGADITPVVTKTSAGASELIPLIRVSNLAETVSQFQEGGFDAVASLLDPHSQDAATFPFSPKTLLIVGSEGEGIQPLIRKRANHTIYIPMQGKIQSLNVVQAAAVLLHAFRSHCK